MAKKRGLGSPNMSQRKKHEIQSKGGKSSHKNDDSGPVTTDEEYFSEIRMPSSRTSAGEESARGIDMPDEEESELTEDWTEDDEEEVV